MSTVAPTPPRPPRPPLTPALLDSENYIDEHIRRTRRALKLVDFASGVITLLAALLVFLLAAAVIDHWIVPGGLGAKGRAAAFGLLVLATLWIAVRNFLPLLRPINPVYAAQTIERSAPSLKNSLLNLLLFRNRRRNMSARVYYALEQQAAQRLSTVPADSGVDHTALLRLGYALMLIVALCAAYAALSPKNPAVSAARVLAPWSDLPAPSRVQILNVEPGDASVARGERLTVSAEIHGARSDDPIRLRYSTDDQQLVDESIPMTRRGDTVRFEAHLPRAVDGSATTGVQQDLSYWIEAGDARTRQFKVNVYNRPTMVVDRVQYEFPAYTGLPSAETTSTGDIHGVEGTRVTIRGIANQKIKNAYVDFDADGKNDLAMTVDAATGDRATASFTLTLRPDRRTPAHPSYVLRLVTVAGRTNADPAQYRIEVTPDYAPEVRITKPEEAELAVRVDEIVPIGVEARDPDFAVSQVRLLGRSGNRDVALGELLSKNHSGRFTGMKPIVPADAQLKPGDVLEYWAEARDNRRPEANVAISERRRLRIIGGDPNAQQQRDQQQPGGQPQQPGAQGNNPQNGEQGQAQAGGQGQAGEQENQGEGQPDGASGAGGQGQQGQQNEQQEGGEGQPSVGGGQGEQKPTDGGASDGQSEGGGNAGQQQGQGQAGDPNQQQPQAGEPSDNAGQRGGNAGAAGEKPSKVSPEGDADGDAFDRMREHFAQQDGSKAGGQGEQAPGEQQGAQDPAQGGDRQSPDGQGKAQPQTGAKGSQKPSGNQAGENAAGAEREAQPQEGDATGAREQQSAGQPGRAGAQQGDRAQQPQPGEQPQGAQPPAAQQPGESAEGDQQGTAGANDAAANERRAADQQLPNKSEGKPGDNDQQQPSPGGGMNRNQGDAGAGHPSDEQQGAPLMDDAHKQAREKTADDNRKAEGDKEPPGGSPDKRESDSRGGQSGSQTGGGQEGKGQRADAPGRGDAGQHEAADQGAGQADQQGEGDAGTRPGDQQAADGKTGRSSGNQPGAGSQTGASARAANDQQGEPEGGEPASPADKAHEGDMPSDAAQRPGDPTAQPEEQDRDGASPREAGADAQPSADAAGQQGGKPQDQAADPGAQSGGAPSGQPQGGTRGGQFNGPRQPDGPDQEDAANLEFARQQTDLVLERLQDQLAKKQVDRGLLDNLGWNEDELRRFVARWQGLMERAERDDDARQELDEALRSLGLRRDGPQRFRASAAKDKIRDLNEGYRSRAPLEYADRVRAYVKGAASGDADQ